MLVKDLIEELQKLDQEKEVLVEISGTKTLSSNLVFSDQFGGIVIDSKSEK